MLLFDDCNDYIQQCVNQATKLMDIDCHNYDILVDYGYIDEDDDALAYVDHNPQEKFFGISISDRTEAILNMPEVVAHEMIHIMQYQTGKLKDLGPARFEWCGQEHIYHSKLNYHEYLNLPWEKEAYGLQDFWATKIRNRI